MSFKGISLLSRNTLVEANTTEETEEPPCQEEQWHKKEAFKRQQPSGNQRSEV